MATHSHSYSLSGAYNYHHCNYDAPKGTEWKQDGGDNATAVTKDSNYTYTLNSITLRIDKAKYYVTGGYFEVYNQNGTKIGRTKQWSESECKDYIKSSGASVVDITFTLIETSLDAALAMTTFSLKNVRVPSTSGGNMCNIRNGVTFTLTVNYTTTANNSSCGAPTSVSVSASGTSLTVSWSGASGGTNNAINGYDVGYGTTSGTNISTAAVTSTETSGSYTFTGLSQNTAYYGSVRTKGTAGSSYYSGYAWSSSTATTGTHPSVSTGSKITKAQMDSLKSYLDKGTDVTQYGIIYDSTADTYADATQYGVIYASWYNNA